jgi:hypothetical protein
MAETRREANQIHVFISYSRDDLDFSDQLATALGATGFSTIIDRQGISAGEAWRSRFGTLIRDADTVVFVLSPSSARSDVCAWEVEETARLGKRLIPVLCRPLDGIPPPQRLAELNYIFLWRAQVSGLRFRFWLGEADRRAPHRSRLVARAHPLSAARDRMGCRGAP